MTRKEILKYIKEERHDDIQLKNVAMFLIDKKHFSKSITEIEEHHLDILLDNLFINNEIIDADNADYFIEDSAEYKKIVNDNKILLLNYYNINGKFFWCKIYLDNVNYYKF